MSKPGDPMARPGAAAAPGSRPSAPGAARRLRRYALGSCVLGACCIALQWHLGSSAQTAAPAPARQQALVDAIGILDAPPRESSGRMLAQVQVTAAAGADETRTKAAPSLPAARRHEAIPDTLEGLAPAQTRADALEHALVQSALRTLDGRDGPLVLLAVHPDTRAPRARLGLRASPQGALAGWFEIGEAPAPGWRLVAIGARHAIALDPLGNPVRLDLAAEATAAAASNPSAQGPSAGP